MKTLSKKHTTVLTFIGLAIMGLSSCRSSCNCPAYSYQPTGQEVSKPKLQQAEEKLYQNTEKSKLAKATLSEV